MKHLLYLITITFLLSITHPISAQTDSIKDDSDFLFWINYGFSIHQNYGGIISKSDYCENETFGIAALASSTAYLPSVDMIFTIRALGTSNVFLDYTDDSEQCSDFGIMIGKIKKSRWTYVSFLPDLDMFMEAIAENCFDEQSLNNCHGSNVRFDYRNKAVTNYAHYRSIIIKK